MRKTHSPLHVVVLARLYAYGNYTFMASQILSSVTRPFIKNNLMKGAGPPKSQGPGQLPLLSCPSSSAAFCYQ